MLSGCGAGAPAAIDPTAGAPSTAPTATAPAAVHLTPTSLRIPTIAVEAPVGKLGFDEVEQTVEVPSKPMSTGWYRYSSAPGEDGSSVILGHVDSTTGPAVFARLKELHPGDQVAVTMSDRSVVSYRVDKVATYPNAKFPATKVYGAKGPSTLNLVTCGGAYDADEGGYQSNVVVFTSMISPKSEAL